MSSPSSTPMAGARNQQLYLVAGFSPVPLVKINEALDFARFENCVYNTTTREEVTLADLEMVSKGKDAISGGGDSEGDPEDGKDGDAREIASRAVVE